MREDKNTWNFPEALGSIECVQVPTELKSGDSIMFTTGSRMVSGTVDVGIKVLRVSITSPKEGMSASSTLEDLAPYIWTEEPFEGSPANEEGKRKAIELLAVIYAKAEGMIK